ncbi:hypothetical protein HGA64_04835 [Candidatus Falkowbacteria bacterium]|nr:hypothetical protein [Candidatus Falkowbacteria bacterium]
MVNKPKTLFITTTHGDEKVGLEVVKNLIKKGLGSSFDFLVANPFGLIDGARFVESDLNRSYPGNIESKILEEVLAQKNIALAKQYEYVIDLHEARCGSDDFIIIPRNNISSDFPLRLIDLNTVLLWPEPKGPMGGFLTNMIELEFGMLSRERAKVVDIATSTCEKFLAGLAGEATVPTGIKDVYEVYTDLKLTDLPDYKKHGLRDFELAKLNNEEFYPLLVEQYIKDGIICYKMRKK